MSILCDVNEPSTRKVLLGVLEHVSPFKFSEDDRLATTFCPSAQALHASGERFQ